MQHTVGTCNMGKYMGTSTRSQEAFCPPAWLPAFFHAGQGGIQALFHAAQGGNKCAPKNVDVIAALVS